MPPPEPRIRVGESGLILLKYVGNDFDHVVDGHATGQRYELKPLMYVDRRDLAFLLGPDFEEAQ